jgi:hypothetical protein
VFVEVARAVHRRADGSAPFYGPWGTGMVVVVVVKTAAASSGSVAIIIAAAANT